MAEIDVGYRKVTRNRSHSTDRPPSPSAPPRAGCAGAVAAAFGLAGALAVLIVRLL